MESLRFYISVVFITIGFILLVLGGAIFFIYASAYVDLIQFVFSELNTALVAYVTIIIGMMFFILSSIVYRGL